MDSSQVILGELGGGIFGSLPSWDGMRWVGSISVTRIQCNEDFVTTICPATIFHARMIPLPVLVASRALSSLRFVKEARHAAHDPAVLSSLGHFGSIPGAE